MRDIRDVVLVCSSSVRRRSQRLDSVFSVFIVFIWHDGFKMRGGRRDAADAPPEANERPKALDLRSWSPLSVSGLALIDIQSSSEAQFGLLNNVFFCCICLKVQDTRWEHCERLDMSVVYLVARSQRC